MPIETNFPSLAVADADNGLHKEHNVIKLGGDLLDPTEITPSGSNILTYDGSEVATLADLPGNITADNGLVKTGDNIQLGGALTQATEITPSGVDILTYGGSEVATLSDIPAVPVTGANNGLGVSSGNVQLGGVLIQNTTVTTGNFSYTVTGVSGINTASLNVSPAGNNATMTVSNTSNNSSSVAVQANSINALVNSATFTGGMSAVAATIDFKIVRASDGKFNQLDISSSTGNTIYDQLFSIGLKNAADYFANWSASTNNGFAALPQVGRLAVILSKYLTSPTAVDVQAVASRTVITFNVPNSNDAYFYRVTGSMVCTALGAGSTIRTNVNYTRIDSVVTANFVTTLVATGSNFSSAMILVKPNTTITVTVDITVGVVSASYYLGLFLQQISTPNI